MKKLKLKDICTPKQWKILAANELKPNGKYLVYGANGVIGYYDEYNHEKETVFVTCRGATCGNVHISKEKSYINGNAMALDNLNEKVCLKEYLYYFLKQYDMKKIISGSAQPQITVQNLKNIDITIFDIDMQAKIAKKLDKIQEIIDIRKKQIEQLDELIKSKFVEMFGDPIINDKNIKCAQMTDVCEIIDGDRGKNYPKAEEFFEDEYCLFLNAKNVTANGFSFEKCIYITEEKDKKLRSGKLKRGDVVLTTRGTVGNLAFYNEEVPFENVRINSGMVILRMKKDIVNETFFIEQFKMKLNNIKNKIANGSAQPQLPIEKMNGIKAMLPEITLQNQFAEIVKKINKQKFEINRSLKETQELQGSLMSQYFEV